MFSLADAWPALALLGLVMLLPWLAGLLKRRGWVGNRSGAQPVQVVSVLAVGPQQKVVTIEVTLGVHKKWLILGVTAQSVTRLDSLDAGQHTPTSATHEAIEN